MSCSSAPTPSEERKRWSSLTLAPSASAEDRDVGRVEERVLVVVSKRRQLQHRVAVGKHVVDERADDAVDCGPRSPAGCSGAAGPSRAGARPRCLSRPRGLSMGSVGIELLGRWPPRSARSRTARAAGWPRRPCWRPPRRPRPRRRRQRVSVRRAVSSAPLSPTRRTIDPIPSARMSRPSWSKSMLSSASSWEPSRISPSKNASCTSTPSSW